MDPSPKTKRGPLDGLSKLLHLHQLPHTRMDAQPPGPPVLRTASAVLPSPKTPLPASPAPLRAPLPTRTATPLPSRPAPAPHASATPSPDEKIVTDYDRIYDLVKNRQTVKLDEIARLLALKEEKVALELQTLEDNGLVDVKYPAFGEPLICYKPQDS